MTNTNKVRVETTIISTYCDDRITIGFDPEVDDKLSLEINGDTSTCPTPDEARYIASVLIDYADRVTKKAG